MVLKLMGNADSWEENGSIEHTLLFTATLPNDSYKKSFGRLIQRTTYNSQNSPTMEELLFWITSNSNEKSTINNFKYITLFMRYFIYSRKLNNKPIDLLDLVNAVQQRDLIENTVNN